MYIVIWQKNTNDLYYKIVKGTYNKYYIGMENQYSHKVIFVIDLWKDIDIRCKKKGYSMKNMVIHILQTCLKKLERR